MFRNFNYFRIFVNILFRFVFKLYIIFQVLHDLHAGVFCRLSFLTENFSLKVPMDKLLSELSVHVWGKSIEQDLMLGARAIMLATILHPTKILKDIEDRGVFVNKIQKYLQDTEKITPVSAVEVLLQEYVEHEFMDEKPIVKDGQDRIIIDLFEVVRSLTDVAQYATATQQEKDVVATNIVSNILDNLDTRYISTIICNPLHIAKLALNVLDQRDQDEETIAERKRQHEGAERDLKTFEIMEKFVKLPYRNSFLGLMKPISRKHLHINMFVEAIGGIGGQKEPIDFSFGPVNDVNQDGMLLLSQIYLCNNLLLGGCSEKEVDNTFILAFLRSERTLEESRINLQYPVLARVVDEKKKTVKDGRSNTEIMSTSSEVGEEGKKVVKDGSGDPEAMSIVSGVEEQKNNNCSPPVVPNWSNKPVNGSHHSKPFNGGSKKKCYGCGWLGPRYAFHKHAKQCRRRDNWVKNKNAGEAIMPGN